jgi:transposase-like protein
VANVRRCSRTGAADWGRLGQMKGHGAKFGRKKEEAIAALLSQRNVEEAARAVGISPNTLLNWMKLPEFEKEYRAARRASVSQTNARFQQTTGAAASIIMKLMVDPKVVDSVRLRAAEYVVNHSAKALEIEDVEVRVAELERAAEASKPAGRH